MEAETVSAYEDFLCNLDGPISATVLFDKAKILGLSELLAKATVDRLISEGKLFNLPKDTPLRDVGGRYVELDNFKIYTHEPEFDQSISVELLSGVKCEEAELSWCSGFLFPGATVLDIGANIGWHSLHYSRIVGPGGRVISFEPEPRNFELLCKNLLINGCNNASAFKAVVMHEARPNVTLYLNPRNQGDHRIWAYGNSGCKSVECYSLVLDEMFPDVKIDLIKIDVQGAELLVLHGAKNLIQGQDRVALLVEFWPTGLEVLGGSKEAFENMLDYLGFREVYCVKEGNLISVKKRLSALVKDYSFDFVNLICVR